MTTTDRPDIASTSTTSRPASARSRLANGSTTLPGIDGRSALARVHRETAEALADHLGGFDRASEPQRLLIRRVASMEVELLSLESRFLQAREQGSEPDEKALDLHGRLAGHQRRLLESIGLQAVPRDVTPDLQTYIRAQAAQAGRA